MVLSVVEAVIPGDHRYFVARPARSEVLHPLEMLSDV